jgi:hypothetical protein
MEAPKENKNNKECVGKERKNFVRRKLFSHPISFFINVAKKM